MVSGETDKGTEVMLGVRKKFNKALYDAYDQPAKTELVRYLKQQGHEIVDTQENYYFDVVTRKNGNIYYSEAEIKLSWRGDWPTDWKEIRIPERKKRLLDKSEKGFLNFYVFRKDLKQCWRIKDTLMTDDRVKKAFGKRIVSGEMFFHVPYEEAELICLSGGSGGSL